MGRKILPAALALLVGLALGPASVSHAEVIPGVDEPFDPPNYYSPTSISYPDSAPSLFTLRELLGGSFHEAVNRIIENNLSHNIFHFNIRQELSDMVNSSSASVGGGDVYDYFRDLKNQLINSQFGQLLAQVVDIVNLADRNMQSWRGFGLPSGADGSLVPYLNMQAQHMDRYGNRKDNGSIIGGDVTETNNAIISVLGQNTTDNRTSLDAEKAKEIFMLEPKSEGEFLLTSSSDYDIDARDRWYLEQLRQIMLSSSNISGDQQSILAAGDYASELSAATDGNLQAKQARDLAQTLNTQVKLDGEELRNKLIQLKIMERMYEADKRNREESAIRGNSMSIADPYNTDYLNYIKNEYGYERGTSNPMPDFK